MLDSNRYLYVLVQSKECEDLCDDAIQEMIPDGWWLTNKAAKFVLSVKVHRHAGVFMKTPADASKSGTRASIRAKSRERMQEQRAEDRKQRNQSIEVRVEAQKRKLLMEERIAAEHIETSKKTRESASIKNWTANLRSYRTQLKDLELMKDHYVKRHGEDAYEEKYGQLMDKYFDAQAQMDNADVADVTDHVEDNNNDNLDVEEGIDDSEVEIA